MRGTPYNPHFFNFQKSPSNSIITIGDGNCAFNAFALGLCYLIENNELNTLPSDLRNSLKTHLNLADDRFETIKAWVKKAVTIKRQRDLAPLLRAFSVQLIEKDYEKYYKESYIESLYRAYRNFSDSGEKDDTFCVHADILFQFNQLKKTRSSSTEKKEDQERLEKVILSRIWDVLKATIYFNKIRQSATHAFDTERWASDVELGALALYLGIDLRYQAPRSTQPTSCGIGHGAIALKELESLEKLSDENTVARVLQRQGVGCKYLGYFCLNIRLDSIHSLQRLLKSLPDQELKCLEELLSKKQKFLQQPETISIEAWQEFCAHLKEREIIASDHEKYKFIGDNLDHIDEAAIRKKAQGVPESWITRLEAAYQPQPPQFFITFSGNHWSFSPVDRPISTTSALPLSLEKKKGLRTATTDVSNSTKPSNPATTRQEDFNKIDLLEMIRKASEHSSAPAISPATQQNTSTSAKEGNEITENKCTMQ